MTTWADLQPLIEAYRAVFDDDPADLVNIWNYDTYKTQLIEALNTGVKMQDAPQSEINGITVQT